MHLFLYEWVVGGGPLGEPLPPLPELRREGLAMLRAVASDLVALRSVRVSTLLNGETTLDLPGLHNQLRVDSISSRDRAFTQLVRAADGVMLIAPEQGGALLRLAGEVEGLGGRLLSPGVDTIGVASDKHETALRLIAAGVPIPEGVVMMPGERTPASFPYPAVLKPIDGVGSLGVRRVDAPQEVPQEAGAYRLERYVPGTPSSVAVVCGPRGLTPLAPCYQHLAGDGSFAYGGGSLPVAPELMQRSRRLAVAAVRALPAAVGWIGVDLVLGDSSDGSGDRVIEVNPRMTTSYVGLRAATEANLGAFVLRTALGQETTAPTFPRSVRFWPDGTVEVGEKQ